ncbi:MAG: dihydroorotase [Rubinisphaera brasiliensis]|uniref:Dihydroorotase n=1 Tax=Rubinisphaera brasiliensis (strain ATCC 49424 / DSM 5305 / JCM 21570 / IAM 15109 / NBRC 103401 / IFAM 1448) TaxID=756272 RepID=F0SSK9_RUBBR|nr:dihydroorotase [Rubinisphaera brasiliensis]ADY60325.1 dihydroorotase [Rubinisphaera brasiliensis DSM 5305]MBR9803484.1 dihydroorotase [bacterium]
MSTLLLQQGRIVDPANQRDEVASLLIKDGQIVGLCPADTPADEVIDAHGKIISPGLVDMRVSLREPGNEEDETIQTGTAAALAGGFTTIACMPDTDPAVDNRAAAEFVILQAERADNCRVVPIGAVTKKLKGEELAEIAQLVAGGARAFSDAKQPLANAEVMRRALEYTRMVGMPILHHPQVPELVAGGLMHEGYYSTLLGIAPMPAAAETIMIHRDIALAEMTEGTLHLMGISTYTGVEQIRNARQRGIQVTADVTPHHLFFKDEHLRTFDSKYKVNPPFRTQKDVDALLDGLQDGTIDVICSDHQPYAEEKVTCELDQTPFGIVGLETLVPACITRFITPEIMSWTKLLKKLTINPARILGLDAGTLSEGAIADVTIIDPDRETLIDPDKFRSKGRRTPFTGMTLNGKIDTVIVGGRIKYRDDELVKTARSC